MEPNQEQSKIPNFPESFAPDGSFGVHSNAPTVTPVVQMKDYWIRTPQPPSTEQPPDDSTRGSYTLLSLVGSGGYGEVWEAQQPRLERHVAIKRLRPEILARYVDSKEDYHRALEEFRREALTTGSLEHPNIVPVYDLTADNEGTPMLAMKLVRGRPWRDLLKEDWDQIPVVDYLARHLPILIQVAQAVAFAHSRGIVHRDLKPNQVMVGEFGEVLLMDWGLALAVDRVITSSIDEVEVSNRISSSQGGLRFAPSRDQATNPSGTPAYMAPEQTFDSAREIGAWTDVFLLGGTLYYVLTGTPPHLSDSATQAYLQAISGIVDPPEKRVPNREIPPELSELVMHALRPKREDRMATAKQFVRGLQDYLTGAGRRRESQMLSRTASEELEKAGSDYQQLNACLALLDRSKTLWPDNPDVSPIRESILFRSATAALNNGDLMLAKLQAQNLKEEKDRVGILEKVEAQELHAIRLARQRRVLQAGLIVALVLVTFAAIAMVNMRTKEQVLSLKAEEQEKFARVLQRIDALRSGESKLAEELQRAIPAPETLASANAAEETEITDSELTELLDTREKLAAEREELEYATGRKLEAPPFALLAADANLALFRARTTDEFNDAMELFEKASAKWPERPEPLVGMGVASFRAGHFTDAAKYLDEATTATLLLKGKNHSDYARVLYMTGEAYANLDDSVEAYRNYYRRSLSILEPNWTQLTMTIIKTYNELGDTRTSAVYTSPLLEVGSRVFANYPQYLLSIEHALATHANLDGRYQDGLQLKTEMLEIARIVYDASDPALIDHEMGVGVALMNLGQKDRAEKIFYEVYEKTLQLPDNSPSRVTKINAMSNLANIYSDRGEAQKAEELLLGSLELSEQEYGHDHPMTAGLSERVGSAMVQQGNYEGAKLYLERAYKVYLDVWGPNHRDTILVMDTLAFAHGHSGEFEKAEELHRAVLRSDISILGPDHPEIAADLFNLASMIKRRGEDRWADSEPYYRAALEIDRRVLGDENSHTIRSFSGTGDTLCRIGLCTEGLVLIRYGTALWIKSYGYDHPETPIFWYYLAENMRFLTVENNPDEVYHRVILYHGLEQYFLEGDPLRTEVLFDPPNFDLIRTYSGIASSIRQLHIGDTELSAPFVLRAHLIANVMNVPERAPNRMRFADEFEATIHYQEKLKTIEPLDLAAISNPDGTIDKTRLFAELDARVPLPDLNDIFPVNDWDAKKIIESGALLKPQVDEILARLRVQFPVPEIVELSRNSLATPTPAATPTP